MIKHVNITISGKVQRVGFRFAALELAQELSLFGFIKNQGADVYSEVEGEIDNLKKYLRFCHEGPQGARVSKVDYVSSEELKNFTEFDAGFLEIQEE